MDQFLLDKRGENMVLYPQSHGRADSPASVSSVVSANDVKHVQMVWGSGAGVRVCGPALENGERGACEWDLSRDSQSCLGLTWLSYIVLVDSVWGMRRVIRKEYV